MKFKSMAANLLRKHRNIILYFIFLFTLYQGRHLLLNSVNEVALSSKHGYFSIPKPPGQQRLKVPLSKEERKMLGLIRPHLTPPAGRNEQYNLSVKYESYEDHDKFHKTLLVILEKYGKVNGGFFVEAGALDGHYLSHSLDLEMERGWNGLLVEASPNLTQQLRSKRRKCWSADVCLSHLPHAKMDFLVKKDQSKSHLRGNGKISPKTSGVKPRYYEGDTVYKSEGEVECFSMFLLLAALDVAEVDLLVLDIEGHEYKVLSTYPFDKIPIKVVAVEHWLIPEKPAKLKALMDRRGYFLMFESKSDFIFVSNAMIRQIGNI